MRQTMFIAALIAFPMLAAADLASAPVQVIESDFVELVPGSCQSLAYPQPYSQSGESGKVDVKLTFYADGSIRSYQMIRGTNHRLLDQFAAETILSCGFKRLPSSEASPAREVMVRVTWPAHGNSLPTREARGMDVPCEKPGYPSRAKWLGARGTTEIRFGINRQGTVIRIDVEKSSGEPMLDDAAIRSLGSCSFRPWADDHNPGVSNGWSRVIYQWSLD